MFHHMTAVDFPGNSDSIRIDVSNNIQDIFGNVQREPNNRFAPMAVKPVPFTVGVTYGPNPFTAVNEFRTCRTYEEAREITSENKGILILLTPDTSRVKRQVSITGSMSIYDAVGNVIQSPELKTDNSRAFFFWNGVTKKGRLVGTGTYIGILTVQDEIGRIFRKRIYIGVKR